MLFRLGELIAREETAVFARAPRRRRWPATATRSRPQRFDAEALAAMARVFARDAAQKVALDGPR